MKAKFIISLTICVSVFLSMLFYNPIYAPTLWQKVREFFTGQPKKDRMGYIRSKFESFKKTIGTYKDCLTGKRACTDEERRKIRAVTIGLAVTVLLVAGGFGVYQFYRFNTVQGYMNRLMGQVHTFLQQIEQNINVPRLDHIRFNEDQFIRLEHMIKNAQLSPVEKNTLLNQLNALKKDINAAVLRVNKMSRHFGSIDEYYHDLTRTYQNNFNDLLKTFNFNINTVYEFLEIEQNQGISMPLAEIKTVIAKQLQKLQPQFDEGLLERLRRQLQLLFRDEDEKKQYDAFIQGKQELAKIKLEIDTLQQNRIENLRDHLANITSAIDPIIQLLKSMQKK